jgi:hypothetical protein
MNEFPLAFTTTVNKQTNDIMSMTGALDHEGKGRGKRASNKTRIGRFCMTSLQPLLHLLGFVDHAHPPFWLPDPQHSRVTFIGSSNMSPVPHTGSSEASRRLLGAPEFFFVD